jgi:ATP-binding cassette subfamily F protein 3
LLRSVCDEFWLVARGTLQPFDGDLDDYQQYLLDEAKRSREAARPAAPPPTPAPQRKPDFSKQKPLKRELEQAEKRMAELGEEKDTLERFLGSTTAPDELASAGRRLKEVNEELHSLEERWLHLTEQLDNMG